MLTAAKSPPRITLHQCLFGYKDGHRLVAGSLKLPEEVSTLLLQLSDLTPGLPNTGWRPYWTGVPLPTMQAYALMQTWAAPEMPRPGCVWTQAVLFGASDIAQIDNLAVLRSLFSRPGPMRAPSDYAKPLVLQLQFSRPAASGLDPATCERLLRSVYQGDSSWPTPLAGSDLHDATVFALWSQQWPRLRRSFSFRTAGKATSTPSSHRFELQLSTADLVTPDIAEHAPIPWVGAAVSDLLADEPTRFRAFLWRYGADVADSRAAYVELATLYTELWMRSEIAVPFVLDRVEQQFSEPSAAVALKSDLRAAGRSKYSLVPELPLIATLQALLDHPGLGAPPPELLDSVVWNALPPSADVVSLLARLPPNWQSLQPGLLHLLAAGQPGDVLQAAASHPRIFSSLLESHPALATQESLAGVSDTVLAETVSASLDPAVVALMLARVLSLSPPVDAAALVSRHLDIVIDALPENQLTGDLMTRRTHSGWLAAIATIGKELTRPGVLCRARTTSCLEMLARCAGFDSAPLYEEGPLPWCDPLLRARDDVAGDARSRLAGYFLALCFASPVPGCEPMLKWSFDLVHEQIGNASMRYESFERLARHLPGVDWWREWDTCLRLRFAVVDAFLKGGLEKSAFLTLSTDKATQRLLLQAAKARDAWSLADEPQQGRWRS